MVRDWVCAYEMGDCLRIHRERIQSIRRRVVGTAGIPAPRMAYERNDPDNRTEQERGRGQ